MQSYRCSFWCWNSALSLYMIKAYRITNQKKKRPFIIWYSRSLKNNKFQLIFRWLWILCVFPVVLATWIKSWCLIGAVCKSRVMCFFRCLAVGPYLESCAQLGDFCLGEGFWTREGPELWGVWKVCYISRWRTWRRRDMMATSDISKVVFGRAAGGASRWEREPFLKNNVIHLGVQNEGMCNKLLVTEQV